MRFTLLVVWNTSFSVSQPQWGQESVLASADGGKNGALARLGSGILVVEAEETGLQHTVRKEQWVMEKKGRTCQEAPGLAPGEETWYLCLCPSGGHGPASPGPDVAGQMTLVFGENHFNQEKNKVFKVKKDLFVLCQTRLGGHKFYFSYF